MADKYQESKPTSTQNAELASLRKETGTPTVHEESCGDSGNMPTVYQPQVMDDVSDGN
ncbi:hypothetical protein L0F63_001690, partial [Massospora cicadina]